MAHLNPTDTLPARSASPNTIIAEAPKRTRRAFRPTMGSLRPDAPGDMGLHGSDGPSRPEPGPDRATGATTGASIGASGFALRPGPDAPMQRPKFGASLARNHAVGRRKTQSAEDKTQQNPWVPIPWVYRNPPQPTDQSCIDLEAQALAEHTSLPIGKVCPAPGTIVLKAPPALLGPACVGHTVCVNLLNGGMLRALAPQAFETLLDALATSTHTTHWHYNRSDRVSRLNPLPWTRAETLSGTTVLFLHLLAERDVDAAQLVLCKRPVEIALQLGEQIPELFTLSLVTQVFGSFVPQVTRTHQGSSLGINDQVRALATLVAAFVSTHVHANPKQIEAWTIKLMQRFEESGFEPSSANMGLMAGAILTGNLRYGESLAARDNFIKDGVWFCVALAFAGTSFIDNLYVVGSLTVGALFLAGAFNKYWPVRDLAKPINILEGELRSRVLNEELFKDAYDGAEMMAWIDNVKKCNGF